MLSYSRRQPSPVEIIAQSGDASSADFAAAAAGDPESPFLHESDHPAAGDDWSYAFLRKHKK